MRRSVLSNSDERAHSRVNLTTVKSVPRITKPGTGEIIALFLILIFPVMGTFFAPESYFAPQDFTIEGIADREVGFPFGRLSFIFLIAWELYLFWKLPKTFGKGLSRTALPILFVIWSATTGMWTYDPAQSINRSIRTLIIVVYAAYLIERFSPRQIITAIAISGGFAIVASIVAAVAMPQYGLTHLIGYEGAWRGAVIHKNTLGALMATIFLFSYFAFKERYLKPRIALSILMGSILLLLLSRSATAVIATLVTVAIIVALEFVVKLKSKAERFFSLMLIFLLLTIAYMLHSVADVLLEAAGRSSTLTGRTDIWEIVWEMIVRKPIWGYGSGFWSIDSPDRDYVWSVLGYAPPHAHNTYLDAWFQLGLPGLILLGLIEGTALWRSGLIFFSAKKTTPLMWSILLIIIMFKGMVENALIGAITQDTFWLTICYININRFSVDKSGKT